MNEMKYYGRTEKAWLLGIAFWILVLLDELDYAI